MKKGNSIYLCIPHTLYAFIIYSDANPLLDIIWDIYAPYVYSVVSAIEDRKKICRIHIDYKLCSIKISTGYSQKAIILDKDNCVNQICQIIQSIQVSISPWNLYHGACINMGGKTLVFFGESGAGKSTLMTYLLAKEPESKYISEDILIINSDNNNICPYDRPIHLREGSLKVLQEKLSMTTESMDKSAFNGYERYIVDRKESLTSCLPVDYYFKISRNESMVKCHIHPTMGSKFDEFLSDCFLPSNIKNNILCSLHIANHVELFDLSFSHLDDLYETIKTFLLTR